MNRLTDVGLLYLKKARIYRLSDASLCTVCRILNPTSVADPKGRPGEGDTTPAGIHQFYFFYLNIGGKVER